jgi:hypothetical protein
LIINLTEKKYKNKEIKKIYNLINYFK